MPKLSAVFLACVGVLFVVYGGQSTSPDSISSSQSTSTKPDATNGGSVALIGDLLTLIASILFAAYQVRKWSKDEYTWRGLDMRPRLSKRTGGCRGYMSKGDLCALFAGPELGLDSPERQLAIYVWFRERSGDPRFELMRVLDQRTSLEIGRPASLARIIDGYCLITVKKA